MKIKLTPKDGFLRATNDANNMELYYEVDTGKVGDHNEVLTTLPKKKTTAFYAYAKLKFNEHGEVKQ